MHFPPVSWLGKLCVPVANTDCNFVPTRHNKFKMSCLMYNSSETPRVSAWNSCDEHVSTEATAAAVGACSTQGYLTWGTPWYSNSADI
jgi:hypothetical protein